MPSEEARQVLRLLAEKKIDAAQAYRLLAALGEIPGARRDRSGRGPTARAGSGPVVRIRVTESGAQKVNIAVPLAIARLDRMRGLRHITRRFGIDLDEVMEDVRKAGVGKIVDIEDDGDHVEISVE